MLEIHSPTKRSALIPRNIHTLSQQLEAFEEAPKPASPVVPPIVWTFWEQGCWDLLFLSVNGVDGQEMTLPFGNSNPRMQSLRPCSRLMSSSSGEEDQKP